MHSHIGKYEIQKLLGKGATGSVYLASDAFAGREVAIKVMDAMPQDPEEARRALKFFQNEASLAGKLRHPHIVSIFDAGIDKKDGRNLLYLVMELVEGTSLQPHCNPADLLPTSRSSQIAYKCCKALEYANTVGVVHRDIKPANILLQPHFDIKVADFGAAQLARSDNTQVAGVGSPAYMSPEQIRGSEEIDFRSDMFSLGGVMYHMLTGARPFGGSTAYELMDEILSKAPPPPSAVNTGIPSALDDIVLRALGKSRNDRFESWNDFAAALEPLLSEEDATLSALSDVEEFSAMRRLVFFNGTAATELCEMVYARRSMAPRSATVTAVEMSWVLGLRIQDIDSFSDPCRARFSEAFLSVMADRLSMLGGRLVR